MKATLFLLIICVCIYPYGIRYADLLSFSYYTFIDHREWWRVFTAIFIHGNLLHLIGNMLFLMLFGNALEKRIGSLRLLACFVVGGILSLVSSVFFYNHNEPIVGASAAICTLIGLLMIYSPWKISFLLNFFPMPLGVAALTYMVINVAMSITGNQHDSKGIHTAYELHVTGFIVGIIFGIMWNKDWKKNLLICILSFIGFYLVLGVIIYLWYRN